MVGILNKMSTITVFTGDTVSATAEFRDIDNALIDADSNIVNFNVYDADTHKLLETHVATRDSIGLYHYDYTIPSSEKSYYFEFEGLFGAKPQLQRIKVKASFKG